MKYPPYIQHLGEKCKHDWFIDIRTFSERCSYCGKEARSLAQIKAISEYYKEKETKIFSPTDTLKDVMDWTRSRGANDNIILSIAKED